MEKKQCAGKNREGNRCRRNAQPHSDYCAFHTADDQQEPAPSKRQQKQEPVVVPRIGADHGLDWVIDRLSEALMMAVAGTLNSYACKGISDIGKQLIEAHKLQRESAEGDEGGDEFDDLASMSLEDLERVARGEIQ